MNLTHPGTPTSGLQPSPRNRCRVCGSEVTSERVSAPYRERGLDAVMLHGALAHRCTGCGGLRLIIEDRPALHRRIAARLVRKRSALAGEEIRFLRGHLRCSNTDLAHALGVTAPTLSRWASPATGAVINPTADRLLRMIVATTDGIELPPLSKLPRNARSAPVAEPIALWATPTGWAENPGG